MRAKAHNDPNGRFSRRDFIKLGAYAAAAAAMPATFLRAASAATDAANATPSGYVATNAKVYTLNKAQPWAEAVAVRGQDIVYVGDNAGAQAFIGDDTVAVDLKGKMILPGFVDTHCHTLMIAAIASGLLLDTPLDGVGDKDKMLQAVAEWVKTHPDGPFFSFGGAYEGLVDIDRHDIDKIISDRPFLMASGSGHGGWVNTKALEALGVVKGRPDPIDSFGRDPDGTPNGYLGTSAALMYVFSQLRIINANSLRKTIPTVMPITSSYGVTTNFQAGIVQGLEDAAYSAVAALEESGELSVRISAAAYFAQRPLHIEPALAAIKKFSWKYNSEMFRVDTMKIHGDGDFGGRTVGLLEPFVDMPEIGLGMVSFPDTEQLKQFMVDSINGGAKYVHMHASGDRTVRQALDAFEYVRKQGHDETRLSTAHTFMVHPDDVPRFGELDVYPDQMAGLAIGSPHIKALFGEERANNRFFPLKSIIKHGGKLTVGSDTPAGDQNPFVAISAMMARQLGDSEMLSPASEKLSLEEAIQAYTINGAEALGWDDIIGSIEVGKRADLIVIDRNLFDLTPEEILQAKVIATMMNGRLVYNDTVGWEAPDEYAEVLGDFDFGWTICEQSEEENQLFPGPGEVFNRK